MLEQYGKAKALEQLIMLSQCVDHAEEAAVAAAARTPDPASWASCGSGSGSDDEGGGGAGYAYVGGIGQGRPALSAEQLAAQLGMAPADLAAALASPREPAAPRPLTPEDDAGLSAEEKLEVLKAEFGGIAAAEVEGALAVCDGGLFRAAELLRTIAADDEAHDMSAAAAAASGPAAAALPPHVRPKVAHLARRFPDASEESLQVRGLSGGWARGRRKAVLGLGVQLWCSQQGHAAVVKPLVGRCIVGCPRSTITPASLPLNPCLFSAPARPTDGAAAVRRRPGGRTAHAARQRARRGGGTALHAALARAAAQQPAAAGAAAHVAGGARAGAAGGQRRRWQRWRRRPAGRTQRGTAAAAGSVAV